MKRFLITGGLGFIGSHVVLELLNANNYVMVLDNFSNSDEEVLEKLKKIGGDRLQFYPVDVANEREIYECGGLIREEIDWIIHFAAYKNVGESADMPAEYYYNNLVGLLNILRFAKRMRCPNFIFSSSATVYSHSATPPFVENEGGAGGVSGRHSTILSGPNVYGNTKIIGEQILHDLVQGDKNFPWNVVVLRYFNPVGAHPSGLLGENYKAGKANNLFPAILGAHITKKPIIVFGSDYDTCDGTAVRDYIHVVDLARAHTMSAEKLTGSTGLHVYNVGLGEGKSVMEVIQAFVGAGFEFDWVLGERREGDAAVSYCDNKKIREELGWEPEFGLAEMVSHTISFFNNRR